MSVIENAEKLYNELYDEIVSLTKDKNLCEFKDGLCKRERERIEKRVPHSPFCCCGPSITSDTEPCRHFKVGTGCSVKAISCKTWYCECVVLPVEIQEKLSKLKRLASGLGFYVPREDFSFIKARFY